MDAAATAAAKQKLIDAIDKATAETLTGEDYTLIFAVVDLIGSSENAAHDAILHIIKRVRHRNMNVAFMTLTLVEALVKNCGVNVHGEVASRAFTTTLVQMLGEASTHQKVKGKILELIQQWSDEFKSKPTLSLMEETYNDLVKTRKYKFPGRPGTPQASSSGGGPASGSRPAAQSAGGGMTESEREAAELELALQNSLKDVGGRPTGYAPPRARPQQAAQPSSGRPSSVTSSTRPQAQSQPKPSSRPQQSQQTQQPKPQVSQQPVAHPTQQQHQHHQQHQQQQPKQAVAATISTATPPAAQATSKRELVRAIYDYKSDDESELTFYAGDIIQVQERKYKEWWQGELRGKVGIFPVNYVEPYTEPSLSDFAKDIELEIKVLKETAPIDSLLRQLGSFDTTKDSITANEKLSTFYHSMIANRGDIVKLIEKYSQRAEELRALDTKYKDAMDQYDRLLNIAKERLHEQEQLRQQEYRQQFAQQQQQQQQQHQQQPQYGVPPPHQQQQQPVPYGADPNVAGSVAPPVSGPIGHVGSPGPYNQYQQPAGYAHVLQQPPHGAVPGGIQQPPPAQQYQPIDPSGYNPIPVSSPYQQQQQQHHQQLQPAVAPPVQYDPAAAAPAPALPPPPQGIYVAGPAPVMMTGPAQPVQHQQPYVQVGYYGAVQSTQPPPPQHLQQPYDPNAAAAAAPVAPGTTLYAPQAIQQANLQAFTGTPVPPS